MSNSKILIKNIFSSWLGIGVNAVIGFFMMPFLVHRLSDSLYGIWTLIGSLTGYGVLLDFGIRISIVKYSSQYNATGDKKRLNELFNTSLAVYSATATAVIILGLALTPMLSHFFNIDPQHVGDARIVFIIVCVGLAFKFPAGVFEGFLNGAQRYEISNAITSVGAILKFATILIFLSEGYGLIALALVSVTMDIVTNCLMAVFCLRHFSFIRLTPKSADKKMLQDIFRFSLYSFVVVMAGKVLYQSDAIILGTFFPPQAITLFAVAGNLMNYVREISYSFAGVFSPAASDLSARSEHERLENLVIFGTKYSLLFVLPIALSLIVFGKQFFTLWVGPRYADSSTTILIVLLASQVPAMAQLASGSILFGLNKHEYLSYLLAIEAVVKVVLSVVLIKHYGLLGVALGTAIPDAIVYLTIFPRYYCKVTRVSLGRYVREALYPPLVGGIPLACLLYFFRTHFEPLSWGILLIEIGIGVIVYAVAFFFCCLNRKQRNAITWFLIDKCKGALVSR